MVIISFFVPAQYEIIPAIIPQVQTQKFESIRIPPIVGANMSNTNNKNQTANTTSI